ncbi:hypothetical protein AJ87_37790 [Rhizobium yanglingense]|nr:hypothetical protein AJ87_37790 [Rhizobium yanglingense]
MRDGHDFDCRIAYLGEMAEFFGGRLEGALPCEGAYMDFADHRLFPGPSLPGVIHPLIGRLHDQRRTVHIAGLRPRSRVGHGAAISKNEGICVAHLRPATVSSNQPPADRSISLSLPQERSVISFCPGAQMRKSTQFAPILGPQLFWPCAAEPAFET